MGGQNPEAVTGYSKSLEHERGANSAPINSPFRGDKAATYRTPKEHPAPVDAGAASTGAFRGDKARSQRAIPVQPGKATR